MSQGQMNPRVGKPAGTKMRSSYHSNPDRTRGTIKKVTVQHLKQGKY